MDSDNRLKNFTLVYPLIQGENAPVVILGLKRRGWGAGKFNGFGGKVDKGETLTEAAAREVYEESKIKIHPRQLQFRVFSTLVRPTGTIRLFTYIVDVRSRPQPTEEMLPQSFRLSQLPYDKMWKLDQQWLPRILSDPPEKRQYWGFAEFDEDDRVLYQRLVAS